MIRTSQNFSDVFDLAGRAADYDAAGVVEVVMPRQFISFILSCALVVAAIGQEPTVRLKGGETLMGTVAAAGAVQIKVGDRTVAKVDVAEILVGPATLRAEILTERYLQATRKQAPKLLKQLMALKDVSYSEQRRILRESRFRYRVKPGWHERRLTLNKKESFLYFMKVPEGYDPGKPSPLLVTIHGTGGRAKPTLQNMVPHAAAHGFVLVSLEENETRHGQGWGYLPIERQAHVALIAEVRRTLNIDANRIYSMGWSRGGHASWDLGLRRPDLLAATGPIIGAVRLRDRTLIENLRPVSVFAVNGALDQAALVEGSKIAVQRLKDVGGDVTHHLDPKRAHAFFADQLAPMATFLAEKEREPTPKLVVLRSFEAEASRAFWVRIQAFHRMVYKPGKRLTIPGVSKMTADERQAAYLKAIAAGTAEVRAEVVSPEEIRIKAKLVGRLHLYLPEDRLDLSKPIKVFVNEKQVMKKKVSLSKRILLRSARESGDPHLAWGSKLVVRPR